MDSFVNSISFPISYIFFIFSINHWLIPVSLLICFGVMPIDSASLIYISLLCVATFRFWIISLLFVQILSLGSCPNPNLPTSKDLNAFCNASSNVLPIAIVSPVDFI